MDLMDIALNIKKLRHSRGMTLDTLAGMAGVTKGYLSQLEHFRTHPSLPVLYKLADAFKVHPSVLLASRQERMAYVVTRQGEGVRIEREFPESGFIYKALARPKHSKIMEPFLLEMPPHSTRKDVTTNGDEYVYILEGHIRFYLGDELVELKAGDSLYFEGRIPHHPENPANQKAILLVIYALKEESNEQHQAVGRRPQR
ncbi:MAG: XRE family transcriptional regulator [Verrucomicrobia bacterium]|nr:XRE family transcriptional regulator [Verrucomicrobiota bacterium]MCG2680993.1 XRE family transcriptional regulator [Kiritimatiellia bacterium]MBU4247773.1 XRE family transcriptional regulator [Verrucomicrobiota bacterium]MBU4292061.1 XRE family transcriptional regulator [Verrucomicrobiota bacterium]MBU4429984.1 XRE family transcriptional regulator [Verrucomicrobiota bacterium]